MTNDEQKVMEEAERIVDGLGTRNDSGSYVYESRTVVINSIAAALTSARRAPDGCVIDGEGAVRKVLGVLPVTKDGAIVTPGALVYYPAYHPDFWVLDVFFHDDQWKALDGHWLDVGGLEDKAVLVSECYSSREAALATKGSTGEGEKR